MVHAAIMHYKRATLRSLSTKCDVCFAGVLVDGAAVARGLRTQSPARFGIQRSRSP